MRTLSELFGEIAVMALRSEDKSRFRQRVTDLLVQTEGIALAWMGVLHDNAQLIVPVAGSGEQLWYVDTVQATIGDPFKGTGPSAQAFQTKKCQVFEDAQTDERMVPWRENALRADLRSGATFPLLYNDEVMGSLSCYSSIPKFFTPGVLDILQAVTDSVSLSWQSFEQRERLLRTRLQITDYAEAYYSAIENAPIGVAILSTSGTVLRTNAYLETLLTGNSRRHLSLIHI